MRKILVVVSLLVFGLSLNAQFIYKSSKSTAKMDTLRVKGTQVTITNSAGVPMAWLRVSGDSLFLGDSTGVKSLASLAVTPLDTTFDWNGTSYVPYANNTAAGTKGKFYLGTTAISGADYRLNYTGGIFSNTLTGEAFYGLSTSSYGVRGSSTSNIGVYGTTTNGNAGVFGQSSANPGVYGESTTSNGVYALSSSSFGVYSESESYVPFLGDATVCDTLIILRKGSVTKFKVLGNGSLITSQLSAALTDGAPTDAELDAVTGKTPATATAGYQCFVKDTDGTALVYRVYTDGTDWYYVALTKAL